MANSTKHPILLGGEFWSLCPRVDEDGNHPEIADTILGSDFIALIFTRSSCS